MEVESTQQEETPAQSFLTRLHANDSSGSSESFQACFSQKMQSLGAESGLQEPTEEESTAPRGCQGELIATTPYHELTADTISVGCPVTTVTFLDTTLNPSEDSISTISEATIKMAKLTQSSKIHCPRSSIYSQRPSSLVPGLQVSLLLLLSKNYLHF